MQIISNSQNNTNFNAKVKYNTNIKKLVQRADISELVRFNTNLKRMANIHDNKLYTLERKAFAELKSRDGINSRFSLSSFSFCEQLENGKKEELDSTVYSSLNWLNNLLEQLYPKTQKAESRKALETEIFGMMDISI